MRLCLCLLLVFLLPGGGIVPALAEQPQTPQTVFNGILNSKMSQAGVNNAQQFIEKHLAKSEKSAFENTWYALALAQYQRFNFSAYRANLEAYLAKNKVGAAATRLKCALVLAATGSCNSYIYTAINGSIGKQGLMSWVFGLHLLNNGYTCLQYTTQTVVEKLLSLQLPGGAWCIIGKTPDVDSTAMVLQALAPHYQNNAAVKAAVNNALLYLSKAQLQGGDYSSYAVPNAESTAQVLLALTALNIHAFTDSRFIKNGNNLLSGILKYQLKNGLFSHKKGGEYNGMATEQVFCTMVAVLRWQSGRSGFYLLDVKNPAGVQKPTQAGSATGSATGGAATASGSSAGNGGLNSKAGQSAGTKAQSNAQLGSSAAESLVTGQFKSPNVGGELAGQELSSSTEWTPTSAKKIKLLWFSVPVLAVAALLAFYYLKLKKRQK